MSDNNGHYVSGAYMKKIRLKFGLSGAHVRRKLECSPSYLSMIETGDRIPSYQFIKDWISMFPEADIGKLLKLARQDVFSRWCKK